MVSGSWGHTNNQVMTSAEKTVQQRVVDIATELIKASPQGARFIDLEERVLEVLPGINRNTLKGALNRFGNNLPAGIIRPARGLYITQAAWAKWDKRKPVPRRVDRDR